MRQWLELAGLDADQLAVCQLNLETTVDVHRHDVRRAVALARGNVGRGIRERHRAGGAAGVAAAEGGARSRPLRSGRRARARCRELTGR